MLSIKRLLLSISLAPVLLVATLSLPILFTDLDSYEYRAPSNDQFTWEESSTRCSALGHDWELPSIYQLASIYYRQDLVELAPDTDYWSRNTYFGFAFGLNTHSGIASFDRHSDTDHFICTRKIKGSDYADPYIK